MKRNLLLLMTVLLMSLHSFGQNLWTNPITGTNPQTENPYTTGQTKDANITVSGLSRSSSLSTTSLIYGNTFAAKDWTTSSSIGLNDFFEFTLTPNACYRINFAQFSFAASRPIIVGPQNFAIRSSVDNYTSNIGTVTATGGTINLTGAAYQNIISAITFRVYGWNNTNSFSGVWGIDNFSFTGTVSAVVPPTITTSSTPAVVTPVCKSTVNQTTTLAYSATTGTPINYSIDWNNVANSAGLADQGVTVFAFAAGGGSITGILVPSAPPVGTYSGVMTINNGNCTATRTVTLTIAGANTVALTSATGTNNQARCINTALTNITFATTGATGATVSGLPNGVSGSWAANVFTISGIPTVSGSFPYTVTLTGGCGNVTTSGTITVTAANTVTLTSATGTNNQTRCINTALTNITYGTTGATGATVSGLPNGVSGSWAANVFTISGTPTVSGSFPYVVTLTGGCGNITATGTITVNALPSTPTITAGGATTFCAGGSVTLTSSVGATYLWSTGATTQSINANTSGSYTVQITNANGCQSLSSAVTEVTVNQVPVITSQPVSQLDCGGRFVNFKVVASGTGLSYTWQYKRPLDGSFIALNGTETNTTYPSAGEIRIGNVGSAQYPDGTQFQVIVANANCSVLSNAVTLSVNAITDISPIATNVTLCYGANYTYTVTSTYPANVVSYQWKKSVASGVWDNVINDGVYSGANTASLTITAGTPTESAEYRVYITFNNSTTQCSVDSSTRTRKITFLPQLTKPEATITQPTCLISSGTITVAVQSATDTYSFDNGANFQSSNVKSGLSVGFYNLIIKNSEGCLSPVTNCEIVSETSTWNGTWVNGLPDVNRGVVFEQDFSSTDDLEACSCQVINGVNVVINGTHTLKITNAVAVVSGSLTFENNASLVQVNESPTINSGRIIYKRNTSPLNRYDFTYWSSPVADMNLGLPLVGLSPETFYDKYFSYNNAWVSVPRETVMSRGTGYSVRAPQTTEISGNPLPFLAIFKGVPHNGLITLTSLAANQAHLLGNPYPSAISADAFLDLNSKLSVPEEQRVLEGTLYFWTHNSPPSTAIAGDKKYNYTANDYATYNRTGGTATRAAVLDSEFNYPITEINTNVPNGKIAAGQGFFAPTKAGGVVIFNNAMRISGGTSGTNNAQFFKLSTNAKTTTTVATAEKSRIWLNLTNNEGAFKQTLIGYITGTTNDYDAGFDGATYDGNQYVDFYSVNNEKNLAIQGRALPFVKNDSVVLGYKSTIKGNFQISIDHTDGILSSQDVFLEDKGVQLLHNLKNSPYGFSTEIGVFNNRFVLRYIDKNVIEEDIKQELVEEKVNPEVIISVEDRKIKINSAATTLEKVVVYTISGRKMFQKNKVDENVFVIPQLISSNQVVLVDIRLSNGKRLSRKIIY